MNKTKKKIILAAIECFNQEGINNVRNVDIAKNAGMSLSNFNYHFKAKQDLVYEVFNYLKTVLHEKVYGNNVLINKRQGLDICRLYFEFEQDFRFFYLDTYNILQAYPELKKGMEQQVEEAIQIIKNLNYLAIGAQMMHPEPPDFPGLYDNLARQTWINNHFWFAQMMIRGKKGDVVLQGIESNYAILYPYLTEMGRKSYLAYIDNMKKEIAQAEGKR